MNACDWLAHDRVLKYSGDHMLNTWDLGHVEFWMGTIAYKYVQFFLQLLAVTVGEYVYKKYYIIYNP